MQGWSFPRGVRLVYLWGLTCFTVFHTAVQFCTWSLTIFRFKRVCSRKVAICFSVLNFQQKPHSVECPTIGIVNNFDRIQEMIMQLSSVSILKRDRHIDS